MLHQIGEQFGFQPPHLVVQFPLVLPGIIVGIEFNFVKAAHPAPGFLDFQQPQGGGSVVQLFQMPHFGDIISNRRATPGCPHLVGVVQDQKGAVVFVRQVPQLVERPPVTAVVLLRFAEAVATGQGINHHQPRSLLFQPGFQPVHLGTFFCP